MYAAVHHKNQQIRAEKQLRQLAEKSLQLRRDRQLHEQDYLNNEAAEVSGFASIAAHMHA